MKTNRDEALEEIWEIRRQISRELGDDPKMRIAYYREVQKQFGAKIYRREGETAVHDEALKQPEAG